MDVVAPDLPGWRCSERPDAALDVPTAAEVLAALIAAERLGSPTLVANSFGCQVAVELAVRRPELVGGLVLISPTVDPRYRTSVRQALTLAVDAGREKPSLWPIVARDYWRMGVRGLLTTALLALRDRPEDKLPHIDAPVLVLRGERDAITTRGWAEQCARLAPDGRFAPICGAAHAAHFSHPSVVAPLVLAFAAERADHRS
jgi:pimeloyl-ACP methyl ester carboxylesterase